MLTCNKLIPQGRGLAAVLLKRAARVDLPWDTRQKSRFDATDSTGRVLGVFLPRGQVVRGGDVLVAEDGSLIRVNAAAQPLLVVRHCSQHGSPLDLMRAAYHLGNRHVQLEVQADRLQLEPDHVLAQLLRAMHLTVSEETLPFEPESGAYGTGIGHGHDHAHDHTHGHPATATPARGRPLNIGVRAAPTPHVHGPGCGHEHGDPH
ncbi:MAG: urease accessory protein UreE [Rubrivivax sp.]|nr:urease accessory protein UreE [Rubrivivax sp.]